MKTCFKNGVFLLLLANTSAWSENSKLPVSEDTPEPTPVEQFQKKLNELTQQINNVGDPSELSIEKKRTLTKEICATFKEVDLLIDNKDPKISAVVSTGIEDYVKGLVEYQKSGSTKIKEYYGPKWQKLLRDEIEILKKDASIQFQVSGQDTYKEMRNTYDSMPIENKRVVGNLRDIRLVCDSKRVDFRTPHKLVDAVTWVRDFRPQSVLSGRPSPLKQKH